MGEMMDALGSILIVLAVVWVIWTLFAIVAEMARDRGRDPTGWMLLALVWSPFGVMFLLWLLGPREDSGS